MRAVVALCLVSVAALAAPTEARRSRKLVWPDVKVLGEVDVPGVVRSEGRGVHLHALRVEANKEDLYWMYRKAFYEAGFYLPPRSHLTQAAPDEWVVAALDVRGRKSYAVILQPESRDVTGVVLGMIDLAEPVEPARLNGLPLMPNHRPPFRTQMEAASLLSYEVKAKPEDVVLFYQKEMPKTGFAQVAESVGTSAPRFRRQSDEVTLTLQSGSGAGVVAVTLMMRSPEERKSIAPEDVQRAQDALDSLRPGDAGTR